FIVSVLLLVIAGCAVHHHPALFIYSAPVTVSFSSLQPSNSYCTAKFIITNVSTDPFWFDSLHSGDPIYCVEWKGHFYGLPIPQEAEECTGGGGAGVLDAGQSRAFSVVVRRG